MMLKKWIALMGMARALVYMALLAFVPVGAALYFYARTYQQWEQVEARIAQATGAVEAKLRRQQVNDGVRAQYMHAAPQYIENTLGSLEFLQKERVALHRLLTHPTSISTPFLEKRYAFITGERNRLRFQEHGRQSGEGIQEVLLVQQAPVEVDGEDLQEVLRRLEVVDPSAPQLLVSECVLARKLSESGNEVFALTLKLIKREFN